MLAKTTEVITKNLQETQQFAEAFAENLQGNTVLLLSGDLGAGKTSFVQGFARKLGITHRIISPTFIILRSYEVPENTQGVSNFYHIDLYRIHSETEMRDLGLVDILRDSHNITVIEWSEKLKNLRPKNAWQLHFQHISETERKITITKGD